MVDQQRSVQSIGTRLALPSFLGKETQLVSFKNCKLEQTTINYSKDGPEIQVVIENNQGTLDQQGPGLNRRKLLSNEVAPEE